MRFFGAATLALALAAPAAGQSTLLQGETITVTGARSEQDLADTSLQVSVINAEEIALIAAQHPAELLNRAPGVSLNRGNGAEHLTAIRSPVLTGGDGAGSFLYLEDGIPLRAAGFSNVNGLFEAPLALAGGVEVVRGPGSAVHGSNALHGLVNVISPDPAATPSRLEWEAGSFGRYRALAALSTGATDADLFLGVSAQHEDGWRRQAGMDRQAALFRMDGRSGRVRWRASASAINLNQETAGYVFGPQAYRDRAAARANNDPEAFRDAWAVRASVRAEIELSEGASLTLTPYARANAMDFLMHFLPSEALEQSGHDSVGLQAVWRREGERLSGLIGTDLELTEGYLSEVQERPTIFSFIQGVHYDYAVTAETAAVYAQGDWRVSPRLTLSGGARAETVRYAYDNRTADGAIGRFLRLPDRDDEFTTLTPHAGFILEVADAHRVFGRLARGARAPQTAELYRLQPGQVIDDIDPVTLDSAELGWRGRIGREAEVELAAYAMEKENVFFRDADGFNVTDARTRHHGIEFLLAAPLSEQFAVSLAGSWAQHRYASDNAVSSSSDSIRSGDEIDTAPEWMWTGDLVWSPLERAELMLEWVHVGPYATDAGNTAAYDGHDLLNLRARWRPRDGVEFFGAVRNLTDQAYAERADYAFGRDRYFPGEPRGISFGVRLTR